MRNSSAKLRRVDSVDVWGVSGETVGRTGAEGRGRRDSSEGVADGRRRGDQVDVRCCQDRRGG